MAYAYFTQRPQVYRFLQWDGNNLQEVQDFVTQQYGEGSNFVDNGDGTWSVQLPDGSMWGANYEVGDWVDTGAVPYNNSILRSRYQEVADNSQLEYQVIEV